MFSSYLRWRHSRGFGVHSPFAYRLVRDAVSPGIYGFYGYDLIDRALLAPDAIGYPRLRRDACLLLRLLVCIPAPALILPAGANPVFRAAATGAGVPVFEYPGEKPSLGLFLLPPGSDADTRALAIMWLREGGPVLAFDYSPDFPEAATTCMTDGLTFVGKRVFLAIPRPEMAFTSYTMRF